MKGRIDSLRFDVAERREPGEGEVELRVHRAALNHKDLLKVEGRIHPGACEGALTGMEPGMECAGVVLRAGPGSRFAPGDEVVCHSRGRLSEFCDDSRHVRRKNSGGAWHGRGGDSPGLSGRLSRARGDRATRARRAGARSSRDGRARARGHRDRRWIGAEIFATAGSEEKRQWLRDRGISRVYSSRTLDFGARIREETAGEGVDVVIGAQSGEATRVSLGLLRACGRYLEIGKKDIAEDGDLPLRPFGRAITFFRDRHGFPARERPALVQRTLRAVLAHFEKGDFEPGPTRTFAARDIREAFEEMSRASHIGKLLVDFSAGEVEVREAPPPVIRRDGCYIVTGGTAGFGATTARWLAEQGAGKILLASRSGAKAPGVDAVAAFIAERGAEVEVIGVDVTDPEQARVLVARAAPYTLRGVVHGAMVLDDAMMADMTPERFRKVFAPKVEGALNLTAAISGRQELDFLVFYSSISALVGNRGQTSYVAANALLDGLAHMLRAQGTPAISINWGALAESGIVARDASLGDHLAAIGITGLGKPGRHAGARERAPALAAAAWGISRGLGALDRRESKARRRSALPRAVRGCRGAAGMARLRKSARRWPGRAASSDCARSRSISRRCSRARSR